MTSPKSDRRCPKCGGPVGIRGHDRGKQRWNCKDHKGCNWHGVNPAIVGAEITEGVPQGISKTNAAEMKARSKGVKRYVITAAQNATPVHAGFLASLKQYCEHREAELIVIPYRYKNPTSTWSARAEHDDWWAPELVPFLMDRRVNLGDHLVVLGDVKTQPTAPRPLSGFETMTGSRSAILGHPKLELVSVPTPQQRLPKLLTSTGAITQRNYIPSKAGKKGEFHHTFGAAVVEVTPKGGFHLRQINALNDGSFQDLEYEYNKTGYIHTPIAGLVMGDTHVKFVDPQVVEATFGRRGMVPALMPEYLVWHDVHDGYARNHHHEHELMANYVKHHTGNDDIEAELRETFAFIDKHGRDTVNVFPFSNHPGWLGKWMARTDPRTDLTNIVFWAKTFQAAAANSKMGKGGVETIDPFIYWAERMMKTFDRAKFLGPDQSFTIKDIEVGMHGHLGPNGARGSIAAFGKIGEKSVIGHTHSPGIKDGVYQVGTSSQLRLEYTHGPSSWLQTHCAIYANGKRTLLNIIDGEWRA